MWAPDEPDSGERSSGTGQPAGGQSAGPGQSAGAGTPTGAGQTAGAGEPAVGEELPWWPNQPDRPDDVGWGQRAPGSDHPPLGEDLAEREKAAAASPQRTTDRHGRKVAIEWALILVVAVLAAFLIRSFAIEPFYIPSGSMQPTLQVGDRVLVNKLSYDVHSVHRGDIVVFKRPANDYSPGVKDLIKRVIGLPGETISAHGGSVYVDGRLLRESWLPKGETTGSFPPTFVPSGRYFMMGDNRGDSADSRIIGPVSDKLFIGRAFVRVWPVSRIGGL